VDRRGHIEAHLVLPPSRRCTTPCPPCFSARPSHSCATGGARTIPTISPHGVLDGWSQ
jgi:hypothetical protein